MSVAPYLDILEGLCALLSIKAEKSTQIDGKHMFRHELKTHPHRSLLQVINSFVESDFASDFS